MGDYEEQGLGLVARLSMPFDRAIDRVKSALKNQGFGVLTEIDVKSVLKEKIGADFRDYRILGACNPKIAHQALSANPEVGLMLPCNVLVYECDGATIVSALNPEKALGALNAPELTSFAAEASRLIREAMQEVTSSK